MSTVDSRELLIQQRQAEKYVNVIRMILLGVLSLALILSDLGWSGVVRWADSFPPFMLACAWFYALAVHWSLSRGFFPQYLPWLTTTVDFLFIAIGFTFEVLLPNRGLAHVSADLTWGYALLFLLILFSTLRERAEITLFNGIAATLLYALYVAFSFPGLSEESSWADQGFRMAFLLLAGLFSGFHARSVRKAFLRAAASDRLRRETDERLKVLAFHFPGVLFQAEIESHQRRLVYVSEGSQPLLGFEALDLVADLDLFFKHAEPGLSAKIEGLLAEGHGEERRWDLEFSYRAPAGGQAWLNMRVTSHFTAQGTQVINGLIHDVTPQRRVSEALKEANQAKTDFLATMSHELRTPLNSILGNAEHLSRLAVQVDDKKAFRDVQVSGETLLGLIEDILVFSRLEAGRLKAEVRPVAWRLQLESLLDSMRPSATAKGLSFRFSVAPNAPEWIETDALRLRQIVANLVGNAIKFTVAGSIGVKVAYIDEASSPQLVVEVSDTGIGVPQEHREKIFEKFTQGEHGKSRTYGGLGLGLSVSRSLADLLGGTLTLESSGSAGSVFALRLPVQTAAPPGEEDTAGPARPEQRPAARVLLVEDNLTNQDVATRMLKKLGASVDLATGGREAVAMVQKQFYDLILMDWQMPVMDGREATARIRALDGGQDLVIVALSGHALPGDRELLLASGFDDYLSKPVRLDDFRATLAKWVSSRPDPS